MNPFLAHLGSELETLKSTGLYKTERIITSPQSGEISVGGRKVLNFCANNYLGLADHPALLRFIARATASGSASDTSRLPSRSARASWRSCSQPRVEISSVCRRSALPTSKDCVATCGPFE